LAEHPALAAAREGDYKAARCVVHDLCGPIHFDVVPDFITPVLALDETDLFNALPLALAEHIADCCGAKLCMSVKRGNVYVTLHDSALNRFFSQAEFVGDVPQGKHILVDDTVHFGSTLANLRGYITAQGGTVLSASSLAAGAFSTNLVPDSSLISTLKTRYGHEISLIEEVFHFPVECLTSREAYYLFGLSDLNGFRDPSAGASRTLFTPPESSP
jgi:hypothetical protein